MTKNTDNLEPAGTGDIVVGIDDSPSSRAALEWAAKTARSSGDRLRAVHGLHAATTSRLVWTNSFPAMAYVADTAAPGSIPMEAGHDLADSVPNGIVQ